MPLRAVTYCHCSMCRRWHGHVGAYTAVDREGFRLAEEAGLRWYASSATSRRGFCGVCGSSVLFDDVSRPKIGICAGTLDAPSNIRENAHIHAASKGDYYEISGDLAKYDVLK